MKVTQQEFKWEQSSRPPAEPSVAATPLDEHHPPDARAEERGQPCDDRLPIPQPLREAVSAGVFGQATDGPIDPDEEPPSPTNMRMSLWVCPAKSRTSKIPFETAAAQAPDGYQRTNTRKPGSAANSRPRTNGRDKPTPGRTAATPTTTPVTRGTTFGAVNAMPLPVNEIPANADVARFIEADLPKNPARREKKIRGLLEDERRRVADDEKRYEEIVERGGRL